jgi:hypothetical protein
MTKLERDFCMNLSREHRVHITSVKTPTGEYGVYLPGLAGKGRLYTSIFTLAVDCIQSSRQTVGSRA